VTGDVGKAFSPAKAANVGQGFSPAKVGNVGQGFSPANVGQGFSPAHRVMPRLRVLAFSVAVVCAMSVLFARQAPAPPADGSRTFEASWSASGERHTLPVAGGGTAAIVHLSGALVLKSGEGLSRGFRAEAIGFDDGRGPGTGRAVWTDERGDRVFSDLAGPSATAGRRVTATITGGTGRYDGLTGSYSFTWNYVVPADDGRIHATTVALTGRYVKGSGR
jgi:hypothetical protein